jgi:hypothetical protein
MSSAAPNAASFASRTITRAVGTMLVDIVEVYSFLGMAESGAVIAQRE